MRKKVIISTGQGRLHLIESVKSLLSVGVDVSLITGWIPSKYFPSIIMKILSKIARNPNLKAGFEKRKVKKLDSSKVHTCVFSEFFFNFLLLLSKYTILNSDKAMVIGWRLFGYQSRKFMKGVDILHVRSGAGQGGAIKRARELGVKIVVDQSIAHPQEIYNQLLKANCGIDDGIRMSPQNIFWNLVLEDCNEADVLLVNSEYVKDSFIKNGYPENKIEVAELGIRKDFLNLKKNWEIKNNKIRLLFTGGFGRRKGAGVIIEAVRLLTEKNIMFHLDVVGAILSDAAIPEWFRTSQNVCLHGPVPQDMLKNFFINSDIYIFPSYCEGAAQSLKEAMGAGMPVIATEQSGVKIEDKKTGLLIEDHSPSQLVDAILLLFQDADLRKKLGLNAVNEISNNQTWNKYALRLREIYDAL